MARNKQELRERRHWRVRKKVMGTHERPRLSVCFSGRNLHVQIVDDEKSETLVAVFTVEKDLRPAGKKNLANVNKLITSSQLLPIR